jgi:SAM-dependent methyltransferase
MTVSHIFEPDYYQHLHDIEEKHWWAMGMRDAMVSLMDRSLAGKKQVKALDVGCGAGYLLAYLKRYSLDGETVGLDNSVYALKFSRGRGAHLLTQASAVEPPFVSNSFDLIICIDTIQHLSPAGADQTAIDDFARLLRPGGVVYLRTNSALGHAPLKGVDPNLYRRYRRPELVAMLTKAGLEVQRASYTNLVFSTWAMLKEYAAANRPPAAAIGPGLAIRQPRSPAINSLCYSILRVEAWLMKWIDLPFGHSLAVVARKP